MISNFVFSLIDCHKPLDLYLNLKIAIGKSIPSRYLLFNHGAGEADRTSPNLFNLQLRDRH
jgi:hypothetical protein